MKTIQKLSIVEPKNENQDLAIMIGCGNCPASRTFKINDNMRGVLDRKNAGFSIYTECEKCKSLIAVVIGWINAREGYSYRAWDSRIIDKKSSVSVVDKNGLSTRIEALE